MFWTKKAIPYVTGDDFFTGARREFISEEILPWSYKLKEFIYGYGTKTKEFNKLIEKRGIFFIDDLFAADGFPMINKSLEFIKKIKNQYPQTKAILIKNTIMEDYFNSISKNKSESFLASLKEIYNNQVDADFYFPRNPHLFTMSKEVAKEIIKPFLT